MMRGLIVVLCVVRSTLAETAVGSRGVVSTGNDLATAAGVRILEEGGNAADAAFAVQMMLTVTQAQWSGIGGGLFAMVHDMETGATEGIDGREEAP